MSSFEGIPRNAPFYYKHLQATYAVLLMMALLNFWFQLEYCGNGECLGSGVVTIFAALLLVFSICSFVLIAIDYFVFFLSKDNGAVVTMSLCFGFVIGMAVWVETSSFKAGFLTCFLFPTIAFSWRLTNALYTNRTIAKHLFTMTSLVLPACFSYWLLYG